MTPKPPFHIWRLIATIRRLPHAETMKLQVSPFYGWGWFDGAGKLVDVPAPFELDVDIIEAGEPFDVALGQTKAESLHPLLGYGYCSLNATCRLMVNAICMHSLSAQPCPKSQSHCHPSRGSQVSRSLSRFKPDDRNWRKIAASRSGGFVRFGLETFRPADRKLANSCSSFQSA